MDPRIRNLTLALLGVAALMAYIISCRASFSPDGKRVLFPYIQKGEAGIALYDREADRVEKIFAAPLGKESQEVPLLTTQWLPDGKRALVSWPEGSGEDHIRIMILPLGTKSPTRIYILPKQEEVPGSLLFPFPISGRYLFAGGKPLIRLDLETGEVKTEKVGEECYAMGQGDKLFYVSDPEDGEGTCEIGALNPETLGRTLGLTLKKSEVGEISPFLAFTADGSRIAVASKKEEKVRLLIYTGKELEKEISLGEGAELNPGNLLWSPDGKTVYSSFARRMESGGGLQLGFLEIPASGEGMRRIDMVRAKGEKDDDSAFFFQIALSPKGDTLAAVSANLSPEHFLEEDRCLFLADLKSPERKVTRIRISELPGARDSGTEK